MPGIRWMSLKLFLGSLEDSASSSRLETHFYSSWHRLLLTSGPKEGEAGINIHHKHGLD